MTSKVFICAILSFFLFFFLFFLSFSLAFFLFFTSLLSPSDFSFFLSLFFSYA